MGAPLWADAAKGAPLGAAMITASDNRLTIADYSPVEGQQIMFDTPSGGADGVIRPDVPYFVVDVDGLTFRIAPSAGALAMEFSADGTAEAYDIAGVYRSHDLRNIFASFLGKGDHSGAFSARTGLFPSGTEDNKLTVSGHAWETADLGGVVRHSSGNTFAVAHPAENGVIPAAESQPRIDAIDLRVNVSEFDGSGRVETELVYVTGTAAALPSEPALTDNAERVGTITVYANDLEPPERFVSARYTTLIGGITPVLDESQYPGPGSRFKGMSLYDIEKRAIVVNENAGDSWGVAGSTRGYQLMQELYFTSSTSFVKANYPGLRAVKVCVQAGGGGGGQCDATSSGEASASGGGGGGEYSEKWIDASDLSASETVTVGAGGTGGSVGAEQGGYGGNSAFGSHCTAIGGQGGFRRGPTTNFNAATGGLGGTGGQGDMRIPGGGGTAGMADARGTEGGVAGHGGGSFLSNPSRQYRGNSGRTGDPGLAYGGGGGGAVNTASQAARVGAAGAQGIVIVRLYA